MKHSYSSKDISLLFETSWEVCNKIGGIYTVLSTKARELHQLYGDRLIFIGPDVWNDDNPSPYFIERKTLLKSAASRCRLPHDIKIRVGRWNIPGSPLVVLVDFHTIFPLLDRYYGEMWETYGVDSLHAYGDYGEACAFSLAAAMVIEALTAHLNADERGVAAHFDEWTTGMGLLYLEKHLPQAATLFTTHATSIGRSICGNGKALYKYFEHYNGDQMASELNMESKHSLEKTAAMRADCFTTVSEVTARECRQLLDKTPDVITPNGFEPDFVPASTKYAKLRANGRSRLLKIAGLLSGREFPEDTFIIATSGRNEYRNKGLDLFLDSMRRLAMLVKDSPKQNVLAIVAVPAWVKEPSGALLVDLNNGGDEHPQPDYLTHRLNNEDSDSVACRIRAIEAEGMPENLKIIYIPCYLDGTDGILDISYYYLLPAIDLTVFPSYYEPWGYTPLESIAFGVPTVTTDKAGFGQWVLSNFPNSIFTTGVEVMSRNDDNYGDTCENIAQCALQLMSAPVKECANAAKAAKATSEAADWKFFIKEYLKAFDIAFRNRDSRN